MRQFLFLRHGETDANRAGIVMGSRDDPLNETGRAQARAAAARLGAAGVEIDQILSSPQARALETAHIVAGTYGRGCVIDPRLRERHWGIHEGRPRENRSRNPVGGESSAALAARARMLATQFGAPGAKTVLLVGHSGLFTALIAVLDVRSGGPKRAANATPYRLAVNGTGWRIDEIRPSGHLL